MSCPFHHPSRRGLLAAAGGLLAATSTPAQAEVAAPGMPVALSQREPFHGAHQGGIATPQQTHCYFAALDLTAKTRDDVVAMLRAWTTAAARMTLLFLT